MPIQKLFLTFLGTGLIPGLAQESASLLAAVLGMLILHTLGMETLFMVTFVVSIVSVFEVNKHLASHPENDTGTITIDDASGMWLSLMITLSTAVTLSIPYAEWIGMLVAWGTFTLFQHWRPSTIGWMYRELKGGLGMVLSSVLSGIAGGLLSVIVLMGLEKIL